MDNAAIVGIQKPASNLLDNDLNRGEGEHALLLQDVGEGHPLHIGHGNEKLLVLFSEVENLDNVLVVQFLHGLGFQVESLDSLFIGRRIQNLQGHFAAEPFVQSLVDITHTSTAKGVYQVIILVKGTRKFICLILGSGLILLF